MKRLLAGFLAMALLCAGCASNDPGVSTIVSGGGEVESLAFSEEPSQAEEYDPEFPPAESELPSASGESVSAQSQSQAASVTQTAASSASIPSSSSSSSGSSSVKEASIAYAEEDEDVAGASTTLTGELRGVWISYLELETLLMGASKATFEKNIATVFDNAVSLNLNTVFVHVRPFGDAIYPSDQYPWSYLVTGTEGKSPGYDPLKLMIDAAHSRGLRLEAWINPYRIRNQGYKYALCADNPAKDFVASGSDAVIQWDGGLYYNPGSHAARRMIVEGVREIVANYNVDGIHFDDYFYPTTNMSFDADTYKEQKSEFAGMSQADWRRENVNILVRAVYSAVKETDSAVLFGISPAGNMDNNYNAQFIDIKKWVQNTGYLDYICPQIYWGFNHATAPFSKVADSWNALITQKSVKLYVGLAAYKICTMDTPAGDSGKTEWLYENDLLKRMVEKSRGLSRYNGFILYRYDSLFRPSGKVAEDVKIEISNLKKILK